MADAGRNAQRIIAGSVREWVPRGAGVLVAVSGGVDSVTLLDAVVSAYGTDPRKRHIRVEVAHVDHASRPSSGTDADAVGSLVEQLEAVPFHRTRLDPVPDGENLEARWREARYRYFEHLRVERQLDYVLTGHNRDDVVETLLWRLAANREVRIPSHRDERRHLVRPLLSVDRGTILQYAQFRGLVWQEDPSNADSSFTRNRIRNLVLPMLEKHLGDISPLLAEQGRRLEADAAFLWSLAQNQAASVQAESMGSKAWVRGLAQTLSVQPEALQWRTVALVLAPALGFRIGPKHGERVVRFVLGSRSVLELPGGVRVRRYQGTWLFERNSAIPVETG